MSKGPGKKAGSSRRPSAPRVKVEAEPEVDLPRDVEEALEQIANANDGTLTPSAVLSAARRRDSPLHDQFEWNDAKAAAKYRIAQARELIRSVRIVFVEETISFTLPAYVKDPRIPSNEQGYVSVRAAKRDEDVSREICVREFERARSALVRAQSVTRFLQVSGEVSSVIEIIDSLAAKVSEHGTAGHG